MQVNIKRLNENAVIPTYAKHGDAGMDLTATSKEYDENGNVVYGTGLAFEIPFGHVGYVFPRSSNSKKDLLLSNSVGVIDSGYRGEVMFKFKPSVCYMDYSEKSDEDFKKESDFIGIPQLSNFDGRDLPYAEEYRVGDRIGQIIIMPIPHIEFNEVDELSSTDRGTGGFGSTDK